MNAVDLARHAYSSAETPVRTTRDKEYDVFARVTHRLRGASGAAAEDFSGLARAIHDNRRLWTALAADAAGESNGLPPRLKAQIIYLCEFTGQHSRKVLSGTASADVLIEINTAIMRGLRERSATA